MTELWDLYDLELFEVSSVDRGDNEGARVMLFKRNPDAPSSSPAAPGLPDEAIERIVSEVIEEEVQSTRTSTTSFLADGTTVMSKRSDVLAVVTAEAEDLMKREPEKYRSEAAARGEAWRRRPDLVELYNSLAHEPAPAPADPLSKLSPAIQQATREAQALMKAHPEKYRSLSSARLAVYAGDPALAERCAREASGRRA
ncbi:MAG: hypothetical protein M3N33_02015 [Actinomycetota bacterium]|nr:hypothetical protein [Actinomycetota bacterium]